MRKDEPPPERVPPKAIAEHHARYSEKSQIRLTARSAGAGLGFDGRGDIGRQILRRRNAWPIRETSSWPAAI
jgi:hypothetical protein